MNEERIYWASLAYFRPFGAIRISRLGAYFADMRTAFHANIQELMEAGIEEGIAKRFVQERAGIDPEKIAQDLEIAGIWILTLQDEIYPPLLKEIYDPPAVLFVRGTLPDPTKKHVAVVGSRKASSYGTRAAQECVQALSRAGMVIVSGLAYGIDSIAHEIALDAGGLTLAVLGSGIDEQSIYPSANRALASRIVDGGGALVSEFPLGTLPRKQHFPFRNRVIAGLCQGTLVVEATVKSGSLITARCALEQGREVYAIPGSIYSELCEGPNNLIKMGATPVTKVTDLFGIEEIQINEPKTVFEPEGEEETKIWQSLCTTPMHIDELIRATGMQTHKAASTLMLLEIKGAVKHHGGQFYTRSS